jgi:RHS repeat-associated protein
VQWRELILAPSGLIAQRSQSSGGTVSLLYLHLDGQGSVEALSDPSGTVVSRQGYDRWGSRRDADGWGTGSASSQTAKGYTGHEMADAVGVIHMGGRVYDPLIGRFTSADPILQAPGDLQSYNRYGYVGNNPLSRTDPSGYSWLGNALHRGEGWLRQNWRSVAMIAIAVATPYAAVWAFNVGNIAALSITQAALAGAVGGFAAGMIGSGGDLQAGLIGAASGAAFAGIGQTVGKGATWKNASQMFKKVIAHGVGGGASSVAQGGRFGQGFLSTGVSAFFAPGIDQVAGGNPALGTLASAALGGTTAALGGGKFANGAVTAAFLQTLASAADYYRRTTGFAADPTPGDQYYFDEKGVCCEYPIEKGGLTPGPVYDVFGFNEQLTDDFWADFGKQGGGLGKFLRWVPGVPATAHLHDTWLNPLTANGTAIGPLTNYGTMLPAYAVSSAAIVGNATQGWQNNPMVWHAITQRYDDND